MPAEAAQTVLAPAQADEPVLAGMAHERCDRCGFRACVMTLHGDRGLPLSWCKHHFERHGAALADNAGVLVVIDDRAQLITTV